jgi:Asp-tRNA(Asn)/Glu-tRNA(Gln) amidotransferase B subunit
LLSWKQLKLAFKLRKLYRTVSKGEIDRIINEVFSDAPKEVKEVVNGILSINIDNSRDPREVAREIGIKLGIKEEELDDFVDTVMTIAEEMREFIKPEKE